LNELQTANRWFQRALEAAPDDTATRVRWGDLYADSHQHADAMAIYREALADDPDDAYARLGSARVLVNSFEGAANEILTELLADTAAASGARAAALLLVATTNLEAGNRDAALQALEEAEKLVAAEDWPPLDIYALRAAADLVNDVSDSPWTAKALAYNSRYGGIYATPARIYVITRRYRDAIDLYQKAVDIEPGLAAAHEELGINLLRDNQISRARKHLEIAYREDPFSPKAVNTLRLLDSFADFRLVEDIPDQPGDMPVILRLHEDEAAVIAPYAIALARESIAEFSHRYDFVLREPVIIEMYPDHEDFAVRTAGMPGIGILGATFGYVVAMDSPSGRPAQEYQWGTTLWHEMAHVFTLEASDHLVPRWFSEGISVYEEWRSGPNPGVRIPMSVYSAMHEQRFLPIARLDEGFIRPTYEGQVLVSYMQAGLICQFIDRDFGTEKLRGLLLAFRDGQQTAAAIEAVLDLAPGRFDAVFAAFVDSTYGPVTSRLADWHATQARIGADVAAENWTDVAANATQLIEMMPQYIEADSPYLALARAQEELGAASATLAALETFWQKGGYDPQALKKLAAGLTEAGRPDDAIAVMQSINYVDPLDQELHGMLGDLLLDSGRAAAALREFEVALALDPHDKATAWYRMARAHHQLGDTAATQETLLRALDIAPNFRPAQRLLLELASTTSE
ncbi:MAG: tetratricopeptide repeat protein, partial [Gammaproteobacteria bacterium]|nr:tetratricopeptide repeat protein [Gammaproteobacteria bacterium]